MSTIASRPAAGVARFVAYDRSIARVGNPEDGTAISVRAETFVEEYASIRIADFKEKSNGDGFDTVYVKFDAASTGAQGMQHDFGASAEPGGALAARLRQAYESSTPVYVAIETRRRKHVEKKRDEPIDVQTPIHVLRGAVGESTKGDPQTTKANCVKVIVAAGAVDDASDTAVASEKDLRSDISEWAQLRANKIGDLPPEGWRCLVRDGIHTGGITNAPAAGGTDTAAIAAAVAEHLADRPGTRNGQPSAASTTVRGRPGMVAEAKPWEPLNTDGRPNMGSELAMKIRAVHESAVYMFSGALETADTLPEISEEESLDHVWGLTETLLWLADKVQEQTVGRINRHDRSHKEAGLWVSQVVTTRFPYTVEHVTDDVARRGWVKMVMAAAIADFTRTQQMMEKHLGVGAAAPEQPTQPQRQEQPAAQSAPQPEQQGGTAPQAESQPEPRPLRASEDPAAVAAWKELAAAVDMTEHINDLRFILKSAFAAPTGMLREIDATAFRKQVAQWAANPPAFRELAAQAYNNDPENKLAG
ncbi:hypothetical protein [Prescottella equi]